MSLRWSLASQQIVGGGYLHRAFYRLPQPVCRFFGGCSCRVSAILRAGRIFPSSRYITGTLYIAIAVPFERNFAFNNLQGNVAFARFDSRKLASSSFKKQ